jgi:IS5 family transposase
MSILAQLDAADEIDCPPLPAALLPFRALLCAWLLALLELLNRRQMQAVLQRNRHHPLLRLHSLYDPAAVVQACADYYHQLGPGAKPTYALALLVRAEIVRVWAGSCSDLELERLLASNLIVRHFCGLGLYDRSPDHATLNRFHRWLAQKQPGVLFADVLRLLDQHDPEAPGTAQVADTFALRSPAAKRGLTDLLLDLCRNTLRLLHECAPQLLPLLSGLDLALLDKRPIVRTPAARLAQLRQAAAIAKGISERLTPALAELERGPRASLQAQFDLLNKVLADETTSDKAGQLVERPLGEKGSYRLGSAFDSQATYRKHEPDPAQLGYNAAIATSGRYIRAAVILPGCTPDSEAPVALLAQQKDAGLVLPTELVMDQAGGHGKTRAAVETASGGATTMVAHTPQSGGYDPSRYGPADFKLSADGKGCICPNGVQSDKAHPSDEGDGLNFRFTAKMCRDCPLWGKCRQPGSNPKGYRSVYISPYQVHVQRALEINSSERGKELLGQRWLVEPTVGWLVRYDGCRRARRVGTAAAQLHLYQACACRNLWRWLGRLQRGAAPLPAAHKG